MNAPRPPPSRGPPRLAAGRGEISARETFNQVVQEIRQRSDRQSVVNNRRYGGPMELDDGVVTVVLDPRSQFNLPRHQTTLSHTEL